MRNTTLLALFICAIFALGWTNLTYADPCIPGSPGFNSFEDCYTQTSITGTQTDAFEFIEIARNVAGWLIAISGVVAGIVIIASGLMYMSAGSNSARLTSAKALFKNGVIGALILFAAGIIVNTIILLATDWLGFFQP